MLPLYESSKPALLDLLRKKLRDSDYSRRAFTLVLCDERATSATAEIRNCQLRITVVKGSAQSQTINLMGIDTDTLGGLTNRLKSLGGFYKISVDNELSTAHASAGLAIKGSCDLKNPGGVEFNYRIWSDEELSDLLDQAAQRHNVNYSVESVPANEYQFVVTLAAASACLELAMDGVKLRGLGRDAAECRELSFAFSEQYERDRKRQDRAIPVAKIKDSDTGVGDIVMGTFYRRNLRTGWRAPTASAAQPEKPELYIAAEEDIQDISVRIAW